MKRSHSACPAHVPQRVPLFATSHGRSVPPAAQRTGHALPLALSGNKTIAIICRLLDPFAKGRKTLLLSLTFILYCIPLSIVRISLSGLSAKMLAYRALDVPKGSQMANINAEPSVMRPSWLLCCFDLKSDKWVNQSSEYQCYVYNDIIIISVLTHQYTCFYHSGYWLPILHEVTEISPCGSSFKN